MAKRLGIPEDKIDGRIQVRNVRELLETKPENSAAENTRLQALAEHYDQQLVERLSCGIASTFTSPVILPTNGGQYNDTDQLPKISAKVLKSLNEVVELEEGNQGLAELLVQGFLFKHAQDIIKPGEAATAVAPASGHLDAVIDSLASQLKYTFNQNKIK